MPIDLTEDQVHWLRYALITTTLTVSAKQHGHLPPDEDSEVRQILTSVLNKLDESRVDASWN